jgi:hypothetical protein
MGSARAAIWDRVRITPKRQPMKGDEPLILLEGNDRDGKIAQTDGIDGGQ